MSIQDEFEKWEGNTTFQPVDSVKDMCKKAYQAATEAAQAKLATQQLRIEQLESALTMLNNEFKGLPRSLGYDFTHTPEIDKLLSTPTTSYLEHDKDAERMDWIIDNCATSGGGHGFTLTVFIPHDSECVRTAIDMALKESDN